MIGDLDSSARRQVQLGKRLAADKKACFASGVTWQGYVKANYDISRERADELIRIGNGTISVEDARRYKRYAQQKSRLVSSKGSIRGMILICIQDFDKLYLEAMKRVNLRTADKNEILEIETAARDAIIAWKEFLRKLGG